MSTGESVFVVNVGESHGVGGENGEYINILKIRYTYGGIFMKTESLYLVFTIKSKMG